MSDAKSESLGIQDRFSLPNGLPDPSKRGQELTKKNAIPVPIPEPTKKTGPQDRFAEKASTDLALEASKRKTPLINTPKVEEDKENPDIVVDGEVQQQEVMNFRFPLNLTSNNSSESGPFVKISGYTYKRGFVKDEDKTKKFNIYLPIPITVSQEYSASLTNFEGSVAFDIAAFKTPGNDIAKAAAGGLSMAVADAGKATASAFMQGMGNQLLPVLQNSLKEARNMASVQTGYSLNPRYEVAFNSMGLRQHGFEFTLVPTSNAESRMIDDIIHTLRLASHPVSSATGLSIFYKYPDEFVISFHAADGSMLRSVPYIPDCIISNMGVTTSTGRLHSDNSPVSTKLSIQFQEMVALSRDDIRNISGR